MDAQKLGAFIARCRRERQMTQAELAQKLQVTDKAVSRWERGVGFPDINTLEPLADALGVSVLELMRSEKHISPEVSDTAAAQAVSDALELAREQHRRERKTALAILGAVALGVLLLLGLDGLGWQPDAVLFTLVGVVLPLACLCGLIALVGYGLWRKRTGRPGGQTFALAGALFLVLLALCGLFALAGAMGLGPVPG